MLHKNFVKIQGELNDFYNERNALAEIKSVLKANGTALVVSYEHIAVGEALLVKATLTLSSEELVERNFTSPTANSKKAVINEVETTATAPTKKEALIAGLEGMFCITIDTDIQPQVQPQVQPQIQQPMYQQPVYQPQEAYTEPSVPKQQASYNSYNSYNSYQPSDKWAKTGAPVNPNTLKAVFGKVGAKGLNWNMSDFKKLVAIKCDVSNIDHITTDQFKKLCAVLDWKLDNYRAGHRVTFSLDYN